MKSMTYHIHISGCQMNISDAERIASVLEEAGYTKAPEEEAQIMGIVACSVRQKSIDKVRSLILKWNKRKKDEPIITFLTGCVLPSDQKGFLKLFDLLLKTEQAPSLPEMISQYGVVTGKSQRIEKSFPSTGLQDGFWHIDPLHKSTYEAFIPIQNGCNNFCTYCAVPYTRGREISRPSADILKEFNRLLNEGFKSITLLGQNVNSYGNDKPDEEISFPELLGLLGKTADKYMADNLDIDKDPVWIYYTAPHPKDMDNKLIKVMGQYKSIAKQVHLPLQSGDNAVLKRMNRNYTVEDFASHIEKIKETLPTVSLFTDIIVGFPGESEAEFSRTKDAMERFGFNMGFIANYSPRPGAKSATLVDDIPMSIKKRRFAELSEVVKKNAAVFNAGFMGKTIPVLVSGLSRKGDYTIGLTEGKVNIRFKSSTDGSEGKIKAGTFIKIKVTGSNGLSLEGEIIPSVY